MKAGCAMALAVVAAIVVVSMILIGGARNGSLRRRPSGTFLGRCRLSSRERQMANPVEK
jgi:hypothetical protein